MATITEELAAVVAQLPPREQERVLSFARALAIRRSFPTRHCHRAPRGI
jgi:hypothetical protein